MARLGVSFLENGFETIGELLLSVVLLCRRRAPETVKILVCNVALKGHISRTIGSFFPPGLQSVQAKGFSDDCSVDKYRVSDGTGFLHPGEANYYLKGKVVNAPLRSSPGIDDLDYQYNSEFLLGFSALVL